MIYIYYYVCVICPFKMRTALKWTTDDCNNLLYIYICMVYGKGAVFKVSVCHMLSAVQQSSVRTDELMLSVMMKRVLHSCNCKEHIGSGRLKSESLRIGLPQTSLYL